MIPPREAFLAHLSGRPACGEQSLKVWRLAHRLGPVALDALVEQLVAERLITVETDGRGMRKVRLTGRAPRELPPVEIETETAGEEPPPLLEAAPTPPAAENKPEPADRDATVSPEAPPTHEVVLPAAPEPPEALPSFFRRCGALGASLLGQTLRCALDAGHGGAHGDGATLWWTDPAPEPSPTPPPVSGPREVESLDALAASLSEAQRGQVRALILSLRAGNPAPFRARVVLSDRAKMLLEALPAPEERPAQTAEILRRTGLKTGPAANGLQKLRQAGLAVNTSFGFWRRA